MNLFAYTEMAIKSAYRNITSLYYRYQDANPAAKAYANKAVSERFNEAKEITKSLSVALSTAAASYQTGGKAAIGALGYAVSMEEKNQDFVKNAALFPAKVLHDKRNFDFLAGIPLKSDLVAETVSLDDGMEFELLSPKL